METKADSYFAPVSEAESGQKLLRFLERRLNLPQSLLHRWIRTGQVRLNGSRCKPFQRVQKDDLVRLPPFTSALIRMDEAVPDSPPDNALSVIARYGDIWAINKPAGLPVQPGTNHEDCISSRLARQYADSFFKPAPAHRLDRDTSGILLVGASFDSLRFLHDSFLAGKIHKEYLAWIAGRWPHPTPILLHHFLRKENLTGKTKIHAKDKEAPYSKEALCVIQPIDFTDNRTLLQIRLLTGRTHQIRSQLEHLGFAIIGDKKYGSASNGPFFLHAFRIILPDGRQINSSPPWSGDFQVSALPPPLLPEMDATQIKATLPTYSEHL